MYLSYNKYDSKVVEIIRFSRNIIENIFLTELELDLGKINEVIELYTNENLDKSYHKNLELDEMIKLLIYYIDYVTSIEPHLISLFKKFLNIILNYRNQIAHNQLKTDRLQKDLETILILFSDESMSKYVKSAYIKFLKSFIDNIKN
jgi:hypothetical protein